MSTEVTLYDVRRAAEDRPGLHAGAYLGAVPPEVTSGKKAFLTHLIGAHQEAAAEHAWLRTAMEGRSQMPSVFGSYKLMPEVISVSVQSAALPKMLGRYVSKPWLWAGRADSHCEPPRAVHGNRAHAFTATDDMLRLGEALFGDSKPLPTDAVEVLDGLVLRRRSLLEE